MTTLFTVSKTSIVVDDNLFLKIEVLPSYVIDVEVRIRLTSSGAAMAIGKQSDTLYRFGFGAGVQR